MSSRRKVDGPAIVAPEVDPVVDAGLSDETVFASALLRQTMALEFLGAQVKRIADQVEATGLPGSPFERFNRALEDCDSVTDVVRLWRIVWRRLGPGERKVALEAAAAVAGGLNRLPPGRDAVEWFSAIVSKKGG